MDNLKLGDGYEGFPKIEKDRILRGKEDLIEDSKEIEPNALGLVQCFSNIGRTYTSCEGKLHGICTEVSPNTFRLTQRLQIHSSYYDHLPDLSKFEAMQWNFLVWYSIPDVGIFCNSNGKKIFDKLYLHLEECEYNPVKIVVGERELIRVRDTKTRLDCEAMLMMGFPSPEIKMSKDVDQYRLVTPKEASGLKQIIKTDLLYYALTVGRVVKETNKFLSDNGLIDTIKLE